MCGLLIQHALRVLRERGHLDTRHTHGESIREEWSQAAPRKELTGRRRETQDERAASHLHPQAFRGSSPLHTPWLWTLVSELGGSILFQATPSVAFVPAALGDSCALWALVSSYACLVAQPCPTLCDPPGALPCQAPLSMGSPGKNTGVGCHALLQGIFPTQAPNPHLLCLLHWQTGSSPWVPLLLPLFNVWLKCFLFWELSLRSLPSPVAGLMEPPSLLSLHSCIF